MTVFAAIAGALLACAGSSLAQESEVTPCESLSVWIHPWPDSALGAVSITFDDAYASHVEVAAPLLESHGFRGTFYVIVERLLGQGKYGLDSLNGELAGRRRAGPRDRESHLLPRVAGLDRCRVFETGTAGLQGIA